MNIYKREDQNYFEGSPFVKELDPSYFDSVKAYHLRKGKENCTAILFYAPWCGYCKRVKETWEDLGKKASFFKICAFNCEKYKDHYSKMKEELPDLFRGYPTMIIYKDGEPQEKIGEEDRRNIGHFLEDCMRVCQSA